MENKSGFYKNDNGNLLFGVNSVISKDYNLQRDKHEEYNYPVDGWYWFETEEEARDFLNLPVVDE